MIGEEFGLHELAIEDALHASERPKLDRYATHLFLDAYAVDPRSATGELSSLDDSIEHLEDLLFDEGRGRIQAVQRDSLKLRKNLALLRRVVLPMREVLNTLVRRDLAIVQPQWPRTARTSTTTSYAPPNGPSRYGNRSPQSWKRTSPGRPTE